MSDIAVRRAWLAVVVALGLSGCAQTGDLGRGPVSYGPTQAFVAPSASRFNETDQEREMRDRVSRFVAPQSGSGWPRARVSTGMSAADQDQVRSSYYAWLSRAPYTSSRVRYARISSDALADIDTLPDTLTAICAVREVDRQRAISSAQLGGIEADMTGAVMRRQARNEDAIAAFRLAVRLRFEAYSYALDHLLVETPHEESVAVDAVLNELEGQVRQLDRGNWCRRPSPRSGVALPARTGGVPIELEPGLGSRRNAS